MNVLKNRLRHQKEETVIQTDGADPHSQSTSNYWLLYQPHQGVSDSTTKPVAGKTDLTSLRNRLKKSKEAREKVVGVGNVYNTPTDYCNVGEMSTYFSENPVMINNPPDKRPMASPRTVTPANHTSNDTRSASSASSSNITYRLWQCAQCQTVNEAHHKSCEHCKLPLGKMADRSCFCDICQMMMFIPLKQVDFTDTCCPICKKVLETCL